MEIEKQKWTSSQSSTLKSYLFRKDDMIHALQMELRFCVSWSESEPFQKENDSTNSNHKQTKKLDG